jgi:transglutaminase-like putative cysteine protease
MPAPNLYLKSSRKDLMKLRVLFLALLLVCSVPQNFSSGRLSPKQKGQSHPPSRGMTAQNNIVEFDLTYDFLVPGETHRINLIVVLPETIPDRQKIVSTDYSLNPSRIFHENGNRYAEFVFDKPQKRIDINISIKAELFRYDLSTAKKTHYKNNFEDSEPSDFLRHEEFIEKNHPEIQRVANSIDGQTEEKVVKSIYNYVIDNLEYTKNVKQEWGAVKALRKGRGDCSEYSDLFVAICRAKNIPARVVSGCTMRPDSTILKHNWAEVYFQKYGWVPFEPSIDKSEKMVLRNRAFSRMLPVYIYFSHIRNDEVLQNYHFASYKYWGEKVILKDSIEFKKSTSFMPH